MNVLIADDHKIVRMGLSLLLGEEFPGVCIDEAGNGADAIKLLRKKKFDMMLMDFKMPDTDSVELLKQALVYDPALKVLVVSLNPENIFAMLCLKAGAYGYIEKSTGDDNLRNAVKKVASGKKYMSEDVVELMTSHIKTGESADPFSKLTSKEFQVAMHFINGLGNSEICETMNLQSSTVATYKIRIFEKINVRNIHELVQLASQYKIS
ncbi:MAG: response regulator transcription factor [Bacteroidota bacterium]